MTNKVAIEIVEAPAVAVEIVQEAGVKVVEVLHPGPPEPQWVAFGGAVQSSVATNQLLGAALQQAPALGLGLGVGLGKAADGDARVFLNSWAIANSLGLVSEALLTEVLVLAEQFNFPAEFIARLWGGSQTE
jgi:hypothetical protein